jgi:flagellar hook-basal body complex protein FliE
MAITPLSSSPLSPVDPSGIPASRPLSGSGTFGQLLGRFLNETAEQQMTADHAVQDLAAGRIDDVQQVVLAANKADIAFRFFLEVRNRLSEAYQELIKMQV